MSKKPIKHLMADDAIINKIYFIRGHKVMLDRDLSELYGVETGRLNEQVKRNIERFPEHFMFQLTEKEFANLISQNATSRWGGTRKLPLAFTEHGILQVSNVLKSKRAIQMSIRIIDVFVRMREMLSTHKDVLLKLEHMEKNLSKNNKEIQYIFDVLKQLLKHPNEPRKKIGFKRENEE